MTKTTKYNIIALWVVVVLLGFMTMSGLSSTRDQFEQLKNALRAQEQFNNSIVQQLNLQGAVNENLLNFDGAIINQ